MRIVIDPLYLRRPKLNYVSPPVCEAIFSGSGSPIIILDDISKLPGPTGLVLGGHGQVRLSWNRYPGALCYNVYTLVISQTELSFPCSDVQAFSQSGSYVLLSECHIDPTIVITQPGCYRISAITGDGESDLSNPICTCECPDCFCPDGTEFYPDYEECLCSPQSCPGGQVWDPTICQCVGCGSQQCAPSFIPDYADPCNCIPSPGGPVNVCNTEQTATCPEGQTGDPVTIPAGTFCVQAPNRLPATIAAAQAEMNAQALAEAESELVCIPACVNWEALAWEGPGSDISVYGKNTGGNTSANFSPEHASSNIFHGDATAPTGTGGGNTCFIYNTGFVDYNGPGCNCNLHINITRVGSPDNTVGGIVVQVGPTAVLIQNWGPLASGSYDFPIVIPDTGGVPMQVSVRVQLQLRQFGFIFDGFDQEIIDGTLTNV